MKNLKREDESIEDELILLGVEGGVNVDQMIDKLIEKFS